MHFTKTVYLPLHAVASPPPVYPESHAHVYEPAGVLVQVPPMPQMSGVLVHSSTEQIQQEIHMCIAIIEGIINFVHAGTLVINQDGHLVVFTTRSRKIPLNNPHFDNGFILSMYAIYKEL